MAILLDYVASLDVYYFKDGELVDDSAISTLAGAMASPRTLAGLFSHPGCVGEPREWLLQRFEELLFHDGRAVYLKPEAEGDPPSPNTPQAPPPPRRFHDLHDAAEWIAQNWPEFDLEANHPTVWRGGR